ncbi:MAG: adenylate/guanylate cyclase domain-containing protein [Candidatus Tectimicrobiota bacterium]|nr:MAG: adenylate/guanylate cyclase domain-containing protein [Candidatus Tectomicrobia bacterium]
MDCPQCQHANREGARFCAACGSPLAVTCPTCSAAQAPGAAFCDRCGTALAASPLATPAERRQLTVLFCDLVASTRLASQLDPEDYREVVRAYQAACGEVIERLGGHVAQYLGDGLLVYFGFPQAHEDDAARAVHAGLALVEAVRHLQGQLSQTAPLPLAVRVGIHTGLVVVGEVGSGSRQERLALGETPNLAARLQGLAAPGTALVSATTYRLIRRRFTCEPLGLHAFQGLAEAMAVYRVQAAATSTGLREAAPPAGFTPLVGRAQELHRLRALWAQARAGQGQVVLLRGEAGIGKSRLVQALRQEAEQQDAVPIVVRCLPYHQQSALHPLVEHLQHVFQFRRDESPAAKLAKLERVLRAYRFPLATAVPLLAALLALPLPASYLPLPLSPQRQKERTLEVLIAWLLAEAARHPVLAVAEDLQWADPSTLELLARSLPRVVTARMLLVLTARPDFAPPWPLPAGSTSLFLERLGQEEVTALVTQVAGGKALPAEVVARIAARTDGVPLFVEELTQMVLEAGYLRDAGDRYELAGPLPAPAIPATLRDSLMARLDRLGPAKAVAQLAATLGRQFSYAVLRAVSSLDETALQQGLQRLVSAGLLLESSTPPHATYFFKHALIQEVAYETLLRRTRRQYHQQIVEALTAQFSDVVAAQPELLAHHATEAGLTEQAITFWYRAGRHAYARAANQEAIAHLRRGLELLHPLPPTPWRAQRELLLLTTLGAALMVAKGYAAAEVEQVFARARLLAQQVGETVQLPRLLVGLWNFYFIRGQLPTALALAQQLRTLAQKSDDAVLQLRAHAAMGETLFHQGELTAARSHLAQGLALYDPQQAYGRVFVQDPRVSCLFYVAWTLWHQGYAEQARQLSQQALALAQQAPSPLSLPIAANYVALIHLFRRDAAAAQAAATLAAAQAQEQGLPLYLALATILRGGALMQRGEHAGGLAELRRGLEAWRATGAELWYPYVLLMLAEATAGSGEAGAALALLDEAFALVEKSGERLWLAELYRGKGQLLASSSPLEAAACFQEALGWARRQGARSVELRAATALGRLWQQQGRRHEARVLLEAVYGTFREGFDTADLQEAQALLAALA